MAKPELSQAGMKELETEAAQAYDALMRATPKSSQDIENLDPAVWYMQAQFTQGLYARMGSSISVLLGTYDLIGQRTLREQEAKVVQGEDYLDSCLKQFALGLGLSNGLVELSQNYKFLGRKPRFKATRESEESLMAGLNSVEGTYPTIKAIAYDLALAGRFDTVLYQMAGIRYNEHTQPIDL